MIFIDPQKSIVMSGWDFGFAPSPLKGYQEFRCLDNESWPGALMVNGKSYKTSATTIADLPTAICVNGLDYYTITDGNKVYKYTGTTYSDISDGAGHSGLKDAIIWKDYLIISRANCNDVYGPLSGTPAWSKTWEVDQLSGDTYPLCIGPDGRLYKGCKNKLFRLIEDTTFAPGDVGTYTYEDTGLVIPSNYTIREIKELNTYLLIVCNDDNNKKYDLFIYDLVSEDPTSIFHFGTDKIHAVEVINNIAYLIAGKDPSLWRTDGTTASFVASLPESIVANGLSGQASVYVNAICSVGPKLYFATSDTGSGTFGAVFSYDTKNGRMALDHVISSGNTGGATSPKIGALVPYRTSTNNPHQLLIGWKDSTGQGIDLVLTTYRYTGYSAYFLSPLYAVGSTYLKRTFSDVRIVLAEPLGVDCGVKIEYRANTSASWTSIGTFDYATDGAVSSKVFTFAMSLETVQFKVSLTTPADADRSPKLYGVIVS